MRNQYAERNPYNFYIIFMPKWYYLFNIPQTSLLLLHWLCKSLWLWITTNCGKFLRDGNTRPPYLRNLYMGQEATVRTLHGTTDWFKIVKGVGQDCILSPCLFNLYTEYIIRNAGLNDSEVGIKAAGRNINHLRYADDITLMTESEKEPKSLLLKVKEESGKTGLKLNIQKIKIWSEWRLASGIWSHHIMANRRGRSRSSDRFYFLGFLNHCRWWLQPWN